MFDREDFERTKRKNAHEQADDQAFAGIVKDFVVRSDQFGYAYQWTWLGLPIIQMPSDIICTQEIIWQCKPTVIIETGIAWGGSVALYASLLELLGRGTVVAVDTVLPESNIRAIKDLKCAKRVELIEGSSIDPSVIGRVKGFIKPDDKVMVLLDSNHTHEHVLAELRAYGPLVSKGQYLIVSDTIVEHIPTQTHRPRAWGPGNNPDTALRAYLDETDIFEADEYINSKLGPTFSPGGYLVRKG
ncbi:MAG: cephalosporin hydroxylase family protein [Rhodobacteraceae bacterium]|nr:cephalosporin hydroxylase family protein [Paracoccaceae bacterium]